VITTTVTADSIAAAKGPPGQQGPHAADQRDERQPERRTVREPLATRSPYAVGARDMESAPERYSLHPSPTLTWHLWLGRVPNQRCHV
jgi:hypothetical protein